MMACHSNSEIAFISPELSRTVFVASATDLYIG